MNTVGILPPAPAVKKVQPLLLIVDTQTTDALSEDTGIMLSFATEHVQIMHNLLNSEELDFDAWLASRYTAPVTDHDCTRAYSMWTSLVGKLLELKEQSLSELFLFCESFLKMREKCHGNGYFLTAFCFMIDDDAERSSMEKWLSEVFSFAVTSLQDRFIFTGDAQSYQRRRFMCLSKQGAVYEVANGPHNMYHLLIQ